MKFLLKITLFLSLLLISKLTKESEGGTSTISKAKPTTPALTTYNQQSDVLDVLKEVDEKKAQMIYQ